MIPPPGFALVAPYLMVTRADDYLAFVVAAFAGTHVGSSRRPDGSLANGQVRFGTGNEIATIMIGEARDVASRSRVDLMLYVADADAALARAVAQGATKLMDVADQPYGDRQGGVADDWGMTWWLSQRLTGEPYSFT